MVETQEINQRKPSESFSSSPNTGTMRNPLSPGGEIGRRKGLKIPRYKYSAGSIPAPGTIIYLLLSTSYINFGISAEV